MISPGEKSFIIDGFLQNLRSDGRSCEDFRPIALDVGVILTANGSAQCRIGGTVVIAAVKVDPVTPTAEHPNRGILSLSVGISTCTAPGLQVRTTEDQATQWLSALERCLLPNYSGDTGGLDLTQLCIVEGKKVWMVGIDSIVLASDGSEVDALSIAIKGALFDTDIPGLKVSVPMDTTQEPELEIDDEATRPLDASNVPIVLSVHQVQGAYVVDATAEEAACMTSCVHVGVTPQGLIQGFSLGTTAGLPPSSLKEMAGLAQRTAPAVFRALTDLFDAALPMEDDD